MWGRRCLPLVEVKPAATLRVAPAQLGFPHL
jgi:hypothetical protein